ncbi:uncharacterized protein LOC113311129 [Papaver somniferum]|uniref:uncharacterized protein LOC113311129 n=1 Tax=Papaver somniferum TaxID=3469 RepID=UPI000E6F83B5|nr:uncharacterized protein LOC113311129 [Papaver somniferum]XP_026415765.1 uncharacterized protein LOC113311129 [Papaver somniferum]
MMDISLGSSTLLLLTSLPLLPLLRLLAGPGSAGNSVATRTRKRKASVDAATPTPAESSKRKGKLKTVIDLEASYEDPKATEEVPDDEVMGDIEDTGLSPHLNDIEEDFSKDILSHVRAGSVEGENLLSGSGAQLINPVSVQAPVPASSLKMPSFCDPSGTLHVVSATAEAAVVASKSLPSSPSTSLQSSGSFAKVVTPVVRVGSSDSQPKKKVVISLASFSFNATPTSLGSAQFVSTTPASKVVGPLPSSPDWTRLGNLPSAGDMDLGGAHAFPSVPSSSTMSSLRRGDGSAVMPLVRSQVFEGVVVEPSQGKLSENLSLGSSDGAILEAVLRDSKSPFLLGLITIVLVVLLRWILIWMCYLLSIMRLKSCSLTRIASALVRSLVRSVGVASRRWRISWTPTPISSLASQHSQSMLAIPYLRFIELSVLI